MSPYNTCILHICNCEPCLIDICRKGWLLQKLIKISRNVLVCFQAFCDSFLAIYHFYWIDLPAKSPLNVQVIINSYKDIQIRSG